MKQDNLGFGADCLYLLSVPSTSGLRDETRQADALAEEIKAAFSTLNLGSTR